MVTSTGDADGDGLTDREEFGCLTAPNSANSDGDSIGDREEIETGSDPNAPASPTAPGSGTAIADAGPDQEVMEKSPVQLFGNFQNGIGVFVWQWRQIGGPAVQLQNANSAQPSFIAPDVPKNGEVLSFQLTVTDSTGATASDTVNIYVAHDGPGDENGTGCFIDALLR